MCPLLLVSLFLWDFVCQICNRAIASADVIFGSYRGAVAALQNSGNNDIIMSLKSSLLILDPRALVSDHLVCILMMN